MFVHVMFCVIPRLWKTSEIDELLGLITSEGEIICFESLFELDDLRALSGLFFW